VHITQQGQNVEISMTLEEAWALVRSMGGVDYAAADKEADRRVQDELVRGIDEMVRG